MDIATLPRIARQHKQLLEQYMEKESEMADIIGRKDLIAEEKVARILQVIRRGRMGGSVEVEHSTLIRKRSKPYRSKKEKSIPGMMKVKI